MVSWRLLSLVTALGLLAACATPAPAPGPQRPAAPAASASTPEAALRPAAALRESLRLGLNTVSASMAPLWIAKDAGIFEEYGFAVELITLQSSSQVAKVMASGEVPVAISAAAGVVDAVLAGDDQVLLSGMQNYMNFWLYGRPEVRSIADLRGKKIGTTRLGSGAHLAALKALQQYQLEPDRDVAVLQVGGMGEVYGALTAGAIDAGVLSIPFNLEAHNAGYPLVFDVSAQRIPYLQNGLASTRTYIERHEDQIRRLMQAHIAGLARVHLDKPATLEVMARYLRTDDRELLGRTYDLLVPLLERVPYPTAESIQTVIDQRADQFPQARQLTPAQLSDDRFVRELEQNGFVARVYGGGPTAGR